MYENESFMDIKFRSAGKDFKYRLPCDDSRDSMGEVTSESFDWIPVIFEKVDVSTLIVYSRKVKICEKVY